MASAKRALKQPELIYTFVIERRRYARRFRFVLLVLLVVMLTWLALELVRRQGAADPRAVNIGWLAAAAATALLLVRAVVNLERWLTRRDETLRFYDQGFVWTREEARYQYRWSKLVTFREGGRGLYLGRKPLVQWGAHTLKMADGREFRVTPRHGDLRHFARAVRPFAAEVTGIRMGRLLRQSERSIRLHPKLILWPGGVQVGKKEIHWSALDALVARHRLIIREKNEQGRFKTVRRFSIHDIDNAGGFIELVGATVRNYQPQRFTKSSQAG